MSDIPSDDLPDMSEFDDWLTDRPGAPWPGSWEDKSLSEQQRQIAARNAALLLDREAWGRKVERFEQLLNAIATMAYASNTGPSSPYISTNTISLLDQIHWIFRYITSPAPYRSPIRPSETGTYHSTTQPSETETYGSSRRRLIRAHCPLKTAWLQVICSSKLIS